MRRLVPSDPVVRRLATATLVNTFGNGLLFTLSALYFTRIVGLPIAQVGLGLTIAGGLGVLAGVPVGHTADRIGTQTMLVVLVASEAVSTAAYVAIGSFASFLVIVSVTTVIDRASAAVRSAMYAVVVPQDDRTRVRAYLRAVTNVGIGAGAATAAIAVQANSRPAYVALILLDVVTFIVTAAILLPLRPARADRVRATVSLSPRGMFIAGRTRTTNPALRDRPYLLVTGLNSVLALQFGMIEVGLPLWIVGHTAAPRVLVAATLVTNTVFVVLFQVRASRDITSVPLAARAARRGGLLLAISCLLFAGADAPSAWGASALLLVGIIVQSLAEVVSSASGWALGYDLARADHPGAYQGVYASGSAMSSMLAPVIVTSTALRYGFAGWAVLAAIFLFAGLAVAPASRWAERRL